MDVSIIIVNFNTDKLVYDCIASIKKNTKKVSYEIIVVDNASDKPIKKVNGAQFIYNKENLGFAKANNQGIKASRGKYILLLNSDTIVKNGAIDQLVGFAKEKDEAGVVVPRLLNTDETIQASCFRFPGVARAFSQYFLGKKGYLDKYIPNTETVEVAVMAAFLITPKAMETVGMLNEKYFMYFEDFDYCKKIKENGLKIYYVKDAEVIHIHGASGGKNKFLIDSAKKYYGIVRYYLYTFVLWAGQKWQKII